VWRRCAAKRAFDHEGEDFIRLASFRTPAGQSWGVVEDDHMIDVCAGVGNLYPDLRSVIAAEAYSVMRDVNTSPHH
jgi:hypothetical protein